MAFGSQNQTKQPQVVKGGYRVMTSTSKTRPVVIGRDRVACNLIGLFDLAAIAHKAGGKGFGGGGTEYTYTETVQAGLCRGPIGGVGRIWMHAGNPQVISPAARADWVIVAGTQGQSPLGFMTSHHPGADLGYSLLAYAFKQPQDLGTATAPPPFNFEVFGLSSIDNGDANPADAINFLLTDDIDGLGSFFQSGWLDLTSNSVRDYFLANNLLLSLTLDTARSVTEILQDIAAITNGDFRWSGAVLQFIPFGDQIVTANGVTWTPDLTPQYNLTDDDFVAQPGGTPIQPQYKRTVDQFNRVEVEYQDAANNYDTGFAQAELEDRIQLYGLRPDKVRQWHYIKNPLTAQLAAQMLVQRNSTVTRTYPFVVPNKYFLLDPLDIVAIADPAQGIGDAVFRIEAISSDGGGTYLVPFNALGSAPAAGATVGCGSTFTTALAGCTTTKIYVASTGVMAIGMNVSVNPRSVRINEIEEDQTTKTLRITAEDLGVNTPQMFPIQQKTGTIGGNNGTTPVDINPPVFIEPTPALAKGVERGYSELWIAVSGQNQNENWGGAEIFYSEDNVHFESVGRLSSPAAMGVSLNQLNPSSAVPDTTHTLQIDLSESGGIVSSIASALAARHNLAYLDGEFISFETVAPGANPFQYNITNIYRHLYGSTNGTHLAGSNFVYLGFASDLAFGIFRWSYPNSLIGKTVYFQILSYNETLGEELSTSTVYSVTLGGTARTATRNRLIDSELQAASIYAAQGAGSPIPVSFAAVNGHNALQYVGTGGAAPANTYRQWGPLAVVPGETVCLSAMMDATPVTSGNPQLIVYKGDGTNLGATNGSSLDANGNPYVNQMAGVDSLISVWFDVPAGVTSIVVQANINGATVTNGESINVSELQLESGDTPSAYVANVPTSVSGQAQTTLGSDVNVPNGTPTVVLSITLSGPTNQNDLLGLICSGAWGTSPGPFSFNWKGHTSGITYGRGSVTPDGGGDFDFSAWAYVTAAMAGDSQIDLYLTQNSSGTLAVQAGTQALAYDVSGS